MWARLILVFLLVLATAGAAEAAPRGSSAEISGKRVALVIGNSEYRNVERLANPANDARLIAGTLVKLGFTLVGGGPLLNLDRTHLAQAVQDFGLALAGAEVGLFYYSGHGLQVQGVNWLVPVDANPTRPQDLDFQMVDADLVLRQMDGAGTKLNLVLLDACRNNPFTLRGVRAVQSGLAEMRAPEGTLISYATQPGNVAADGSGANSPYTTALAETMQQRGVDIFRLFNTVGLQVKRSTGGSQQPWVSTSPIDGEFYFSGPPPVMAPPVEVAALARPPFLASPSPAAVDPLDRLRTLARERRCSILDVATTQTGAVLRGVALGGPDWAEFIRQVGVNRGIRVVTPEIEFIQPFACGVLVVLAPAVRAARDESGGRMLSLQRTEIAVGDTLPIALRRPLGAVIRLDAYQADGTVEHLFVPPFAAGADEARTSIARMAGSPGPRLLAMVTTHAALDLGPRPPVERAEPYLEALRRALATDDSARADLASMTLRPPAPVPAAARPAFVAPARSSRCAAIVERAQLGDAPSEGDRAFLQSQCR